MLANCNMNNKKSSFEAIMFWSHNLSLHENVDQCLNIITKLHFNFCGTVLKCKSVLVDGWFLVQHARFTAESYI